MLDDKCCGKSIQENGYGDIKPCETCGQNSNQPNSPSPSTTSSPYLPALIQVQQYLIANDILSINIQQNNNLTINFNTNTNTNTTPPPQTITYQQITSPTSDLGQEQRDM